MTSEETFSLLLNTMYTTRRNKRYGRDSVAFEQDWAPLLVKMYDELDSREFRIAHNYAFLTSQPKWREIFATCFQGRIADHLLCDTLLPFIEQELHPRTFNNRKGKGGQAAMNQVIEDIAEVSQGYTAPCRVIKWDLKGFFPNAVCDVMESFFVQIIDKYASELRSLYDEEMPAFLKWLAMISIHCRPTEHCELRTPKHFWPEHIEPAKSLFTKTEGVGTPIGRMVSQTGMGLYINDEVRWLNDECGIRTTVFMDDGVMVVPERLHSYALSLFPVLRQRLEAKGVRMNDKKFYDQPWQHGLEFLGSHIMPWRIHLNRKTVRGAFDRIAEFNALRNKYGVLDRFLSTVNSYTGMLKNRTEYGTIQRIRNAIAPEWWEYLEWDEKRLCLVSKPQHTQRERLRRTYHLTLKRRHESS